MLLVKIETRNASFKWKNRQQTQITEKIDQRKQENERKTKHHKRIQKIHIFFNSIYICCLPDHRTNKMSRNHLFLKPPKMNDYSQPK